jgi:hypothetical protein
MIGSIIRVIVKPKPSPKSNNIPSEPSYYLRPDGVSFYLRPDGVSKYRRP